MQSTVRTSVEARLPRNRLTFWCGIIAAAMFLTATAIFIIFIIPQLSPIGAPASVAAPFFARLSRSPAYMLLSYLSEGQMLFLLLFFGGLFTVLQGTERESEGLANAVFASGIAFSVIAPFAVMIENHLLLGLAAAGADPVVVQAMDGLGPLSFALSGFAQVVILIGTAILLTSCRLVPRWIGWFGLVLALLTLLGTGTLVTVDLFPFAALATVLFRIWLIALSVALLRSPRAVEQSTLQSVPA